MSLSPRSRGGEAGQTKTAVEHFRKDVQPILAKYCYKCHGDGEKSGNISLDEFADNNAIAHNPELWWNVLKNTRAGIMPPPKKAQPSPAERAVLENWIKRDGFAFDPDNPDPGQVRIRRLTRTAYRNTIRDLLGVDYDATAELPEDDNYGSDGLAVTDVLIEKFMQAAKVVVSKAVPTVSKVAPQRNITGSTTAKAVLSFYKKATVTDTFKLTLGGDYRLVVEIEPRASFEFDPGRASITEKVDEQELSKRDYSWREGVVYHYEYDVKLEPGEHRYALEVEPLPPIGKATKSTGTSAGVRVKSVTLVGPLGREHMKHPANYERFFHLDEPPAKEPERSQYAREILRRFVAKAYRRPAEDAPWTAWSRSPASLPFSRTKRSSRLSDMPWSACSRRPGSFSAWRSPTPRMPKSNSRIDEFSLASRLSYFLWSSMPDEELYGLAAKGTLRKNLPAQVQRLLKSPRAEALAQNFVSHWLQTRDVASVPIDPPSILKRDGIKMKFDPSAELRLAMRRETEMLFFFIQKEDRGALELIDCDYTFLNEVLAKHYGIAGVKGKDMRKVALPKDSPRGGILTHAAVLMVTSNSTRTSPVKRGVFILDNILGTPTPPPPANVPLLEDAAEGNRGARAHGARAAREQHRANVLCSSCHSRMDPLGLSLENFNALGMFRDQGTRPARSIRPASSSAASRFQACKT